MMGPLSEGFFSVFKPQPVMLVSEWAERNRVLPRSGAAEPGPWRNSRTPYLVEIMDTLSVSSRAKEVVFCKGAQIGATEGGLNWMLYLIDQLPGPILAFQPTDETASDWSKQRVSPSIQQCEAVRKKIQPAKSRSSGNTILRKEFDGGFLFLSGTNTPNSLASIPSGNLYFDEVDRYPLDVAKEGDPIDLALRRISNFPLAKAFFSSTPNLLATSRIWRMYQNSDQRVYEVPCPHCGHYQEIQFERLVWEKGDYSDVQLACVGCGSLIPEHHKSEMLARGKWRAKKPGHWRVGFHLSSLYSPVGWLSWRDIARMHEEAEGDVGKMTAFVNTVLGLPWEEDNESIAADYLARRVEAYDAQVPDGVLALTMAVDVQSDRLECEVIGWGEGEESWGIQYRVFRGDPSVLESGVKSDPSVWEMLDDYRKTVFTAADGHEFKVRCVLIDSGGSFTDIVYQYTKRRTRERVFSVKGGSQPSKPLLTKPIRTGQGKSRTWLFILGVNKGKDLVFTRLKCDKPGPGYCHFPDDENTGYDGRYYAGLIAERKKIKIKNGEKHVVWDLPKGAHNEPFDIRVYNTAAIRIVHPDWKREAEKRAISSRKPPPTPPPAAPGPQPSPAGPPPGPAGRAGAPAARRRHGINLHSGMMS